VLRQNHQIPGIYNTVTEGSGANIIEWIVRPQVDYQQAQVEIVYVPVTAKVNNWNDRSLPQVMIAVSTGPVRVDSW